MTKRIHPALAASHGILCAELARRGLTGPLSVFEGPNGFLRAYSESPEIHHLTAGLGDDFVITKRSTKYYPCCHINHTAIDILLDLHREGLRAEDVETIKVFLAPAGFQIVAHPMDERRVPETPLSAQLSLAYCLAVALVNGEVVLGHFDLSELGKPIYREIAAKVEAIADSSIDAFSHWGALVKVSTKDGRILERTLALPVRTDEFGNEWPRVLAKLNEAIGRRLPKNSIDRLISHIQGLENEPKLEELGNLLASIRRTSGSA